jgi:hypothetical protein
MNDYDPMIAPDPEEWLATDEAERMLLVEQFHQKKKIRLPNVRAHAIFHVIVENQLAMGDVTPATEKLQELMRDGLDRHDAIHAIGSVIAHMHFKLMRGEEIGELNAWYERELKKMTKQRWLEEE